MREIIRWFIACAVPVALFGMAAFLDYHHTPYWGLFLMCVLAFVIYTNMD